MGEGMSRIETIGNATLYLGDCRDILPTLPKVDLVLTDPPYGIGFNYEGEYKDSEHGYQDLISILRGYPLALLQYPEEMMRLICPVLGAPDEVDLWVYNSNLPRQSRMWGFWGVTVCFSAVKQKAKNFDCAKVENINVSSYDWTSEFQQVKGNGFEKTDHPCQIPVGLVERIIGLTSPVFVADPFMGSGTTGVACANLGKTFYGIDREPKYFDIACQRIENAYRQERLFA